MSPTTDAPAIVPDRELEEDKKPGASEPRAYAALYAAGLHARKTSGSAPVAMSGTPSIQVEYVLLASISGLKPNASLAAVGCRIRTGMRNRETGTGTGEIGLVRSDRHGWAGRPARGCVLDYYVAPPRRPSARKT
jgi:hypothetical protein